MKIWHAKLLTLIVLSFFVSMSSVSSHQAAMAGSSVTVEAIQDNACQDCLPSESDRQARCSFSCAFSVGILLNSLESETATSNRNSLGLPFSAEMIGWSFAPEPHPPKTAGRA